MTWNTAPAADTNLLASLGAVSINTWYEVDITSLITGDGTYSLRISDSTGGADYYSKEGANPPQLVITLGGTPAPTNTPTPGPSPTPTRTPTATATPSQSATPVATATQTPTAPAAFSSAAFVYDGDGKRVKSILNGTITTYFVGAHYEVANGVVTKYYYAGSQRIAMRTNGTLNFLLGDHLGSTSLTTSATGTVISEMSYKAWGELRYASGTTPTKYQYTGQYSYASDFGLLFYNARWYDSSLGRFAQADTIIPSGVQGYDRYAYANNNPLYYTDPDGHFAIVPILIAAVKVVSTIIDWGWTAYDTYNYASVALDSNNTPAVRKEALGNAAMAVGMELIEPDELSPIAVPLDDIVRHGDDAVDLYRAVSKGELDDIIENGAFRPKPDGRSNEVKWFWETLDGAKEWVQDRKLDSIVKVTVPKSVLDSASQRWQNLDQLGPAVGFIDDGLDAFNEAIISIRSIWRR